MRRSSIRQYAFAEKERECLLAALQSGVKSAIAVDLSLSTSNVECRMSMLDVQGAVWLDHVGMMSNVETHVAT
jgi:hypothetical protein